MAKGIETRLLNGGVNADSAPALIQPSELLNALNASPTQPYVQGIGSLESILPSTSISTIKSLLDESVGTYTLIGKWADERTSTMFLFFYNSANHHKIIKCTSDFSASIILSQDTIVHTLGWTATTYISARLFGSMLIWTDGSTDLKYINVNYVASGLTTSDLTFIQEPLPLPLNVTRQDDSSIFTFDVQLNAFQFSYRITNIDGLTSILSPLSETSFAPRQSDIAALSYVGNTIKASVNFFVKIPSNWKQIDFIVKNMTDNTYFVYDSLYLNNTSDFAKVTAHNAGTTALSSIFNGTTTEALDSVTATKQFESIPQITKHLEVAQNRLILANNTEGYDTPDTLPANINVTTTPVSTAVISGTTTTVYLVLAKNKSLTEDKFPMYGALVVWYNSKVYSLPREFSKLRMSGLTGSAYDPNSTLKMSTDYTYPYLPSQIISKDSLIELDTTMKNTNGGWFTSGAYLSTNPLAYLMGKCTNTAGGSGYNGFTLEELPPSTPYCYNLFLCRLVWQVHELGFYPEGDWAARENVGGSYEIVGISRYAMYGSYGNNVFIQDSVAGEATTTGYKRAFLPNSIMKYGIRFYDQAFRSCGNAELGAINIPSYTEYDRVLINKATFNLTTSAFNAPSWAKFFAITMAKNNLCQDFIQFIPNTIKIARIGKDNVIYMDSDMSNNIKKDKIYGVAVPLDSISQYKKGYEYAQGDYMRLSFVYTDPSAYVRPFEYVGKVIAELNGYIIIDAPKDNYLSDFANSLSSQYSTLTSPAYTASPLGADSNLYGTMNKSRQKLCYATIYQQPQSDLNMYEIAAIGVVDSTASTGGYFINSAGSTSTSFDVYGDCHTQSRSSNLGSFVGLSNTTNESIQSLTWIDIFGRVAPIDAIGKKILENQIRWSNAGSFNTSVNGICHFDASDYKLMNQNSGAINMIYGQIGDSGRNDALLIICRSNGYYAIIGQNLIRATTGDSIVSASNSYIDNINELNGKPTTISPRSFAMHEGTVMWADVLNKQIVMYQNGSVVAASDANTKRVFRQLLQNVNDESLGMYITGGFNPLANEYIVSIPNNTPTDKPVLPTSSIENPLDFYYDKQYSYVFNVDTKKWHQAYQSFKEYFKLNSILYSWDKVTQNVYTEFTSNELPERDALITIPFNDKYPLTKAPLALRLDASRPPDETWIQADTNTRFDQATNVNGSVMVANSGDWQYREGDWLCYILRNRMSKNATDATAWDRAGLTGARLKGKNISVVMIWYKENGHFKATSCSLAYE